ncbi:MAG: HAD family phosphatase [Chitinophagaceae bacterium]|jgi:putative hydrolase of the HAD superfamily|nr:HAD family phosphatase [Chitinophagaceae bacterium]
MQIRNIIFDLGGVLLNLDFERTFRMFEDLGVHNFKQYFQQSHSNPLFAALETGMVEEQAFFEGFRNATQLPLSDGDIENAWNAMLLDFRERSMEYLDGLKQDYRLFLLSNTNIIHLKAFREIHYRQFGNHGFDDHFEKAWYSHELGLRKPGIGCYEAVLQKHELDPGETLFIDDTLINIEGAQKAGIRTLHLQKYQTIEEQLPLLLKG